MRIALIYKRLSLHGGSERQVFMLASDLLARGHDVHLFCRRVDTGVPEGLVVHRMAWSPWGGTVGRLVFSAWVQRAAAREERQGGAFDVRQSFDRTVGQDIYRIGGGCHRTYLDHAHALNRPYWLRRMLGGSLLQRVKSWLEARMLSATPRPFIITNSDMCRDDLMHRYSVPPANMHVVRNGIDLQRFQPATDEAERARLRARWGLLPEDEVVLFLGTGYWRKGLEVSLRAVAVLATERPLLRLVVVGSDHATHRWKRRAREWGLEGRVLWMGSRFAPEECYRASDVYLLPTAYDAAANSTLEALASGLPVVTSVMNGASEIITDGVHGTVLQTPVNPAELAAALRHWLDGPDRQLIRANTRALAEQFPSDSSCLSTLDVYRAFLEDRAQTLEPVS
jgi:UDP-glucose:(heptosyl)LPS alpha-1,3-glucosyltransferase